MHENNVTGKRFLAVTLLNAGITIVELLGGLAAGSLALLSDAFHNLGDSVSIVLSYVAQVISKKPETNRQTFGYRRAEILSALVNAAFLLVIAVFLTLEAIRRLRHLQPVNGQLMTIVAVVGLAANFISAYLLHAGSHESLNIKATYLHVLSDALASVAVIIAGVILIFYPISWLDPVLTVAVAIYIAYEAWPIVKQTVNILMESAPVLDYDAIKADLLKIDGIKSIHHIHAWSVDEHRVMFSLHIVCADAKLSEIDKLYDQIDQLMLNKYGICHVTIQAECHRDDGEKMFDTHEDEQHGM
ncbi:cation diffusion facilitator family transporter [uncultured Limosilactobacillus sp.]|uniref:cation diffusion facilitator family transporter n=1 Tax=uncultured Limosilactobacillus sp. TaxID=2837629 RepID=UPI0025D65342|nr:cation diffusion facilitator family transporter [uncultured Limosilactobacillus sp.]